MPDLTAIEQAAGVRLEKGRALDEYKSYAAYDPLAYYMTMMRKADAALTEAYAVIVRLVGEMPVAGACPECGIDPERLKQAEAELAALKARRCETCGFPSWYGNSPYGRCIQVNHISPDFACNRWQPQEESER